jgi:hypothetical protein
MPWNSAGRERRWSDPARRAGTTTFAGRGFVQSRSSGNGVETQFPAAVRVISFADIEDGPAWMRYISAAALVLALVSLAVSLRVRRVRMNSPG